MPPRDDTDSQGSFVPSQGELSSIEEKAERVLESKQSPAKYVTYFVVTVDREAEQFGLLEFLRRNFNNSSCVVKYYVGKKTLGSRAITHDIAADHNSRHSSSICEDMASGNRVAYEVVRHHHANDKDMLAEEAFFLYMGGWNSAPSSRKTMQWLLLNSRQEQQNVVEHLSPKARHDAYRLGYTRSHPLICLVKNCCVNHNKEGRSFYGKFHVKDEDVRKLNFGSD